MVCEYCDTPLPKAAQANRDGEQLCGDCQKERNRKDGISHPSPCCGLQTEWVNTYYRRCPCGRTHRF